MSNDSTPCSARSKPSRRGEAPEAAGRLPPGRSTSGRGSWCKRVPGRVFCFGRVADDPKGSAVREQWLEQKDGFLAGRESRAKADGLTVTDLSKAETPERQEKAGKTIRRAPDTLPA